LERVRRFDGLASGRHGALVDAPDACGLAAAAPVSRGGYYHLSSRALGISISAISMYENGNRESDFETPELIADGSYAFIHAQPDLVDKESDNFHVLGRVLSAVRGGK